MTPELSAVAVAPAVTGCRSEHRPVVFAVCDGGDFKATVQQYVAVTLFQQGCSRPLFAALGRYVARGYRCIGVGIGRCVRGRKKTTASRIPELRQLEGAVPQQMQEERVRDVGCLVPSGVSW